MQMNIRTKLGINTIIDVAKITITKVPIIPANKTAYSNKNSILVLISIF